MRPNKINPNWWNLFSIIYIYLPISYVYLEDRQKTTKETDFDATYTYIVDIIKRTSNFKEIKGFDSSINGIMAMQSQLYFSSEDCIVYHKLLYK